MVWSWSSLSWFFEVLQAGVDLHVHGFQQVEVAKLVEVLEKLKLDFVEAMAAGLAWKASGALVGGCWALLRAVVKTNSVMICPSLPV